MLNLCDWSGAQTTPSIRRELALSQTPTWVVSVGDMS